MHGRGGMCGRGDAWQGACMAGEMATEVGGVHPTGMHFCLLYIFPLYTLHSKFFQHPSRNVVGE